VPTYLVESYLPRAASETAATVAALLRCGPDARFRFSVVLPDEEMCLHVLEGASVEVVRATTERAELRCERISRVVLISPEDLETGGSSR
jgi:hypothetical protein